MLSVFDTSRPIQPSIVMIVAWQSPTTLQPSRIPLGLVECHGVDIPVVSLSQYVADALVTNKIPSLEYATRNQ